MNVKKTVIRIILLIFLSFAIGFGAYSCNAKRLVGDSLPMPFGFGFANVMSGSMEPELSVNDVIFVKRCDSYKVGETVVFQDGYGSLTVHKIIAVNGDRILTKGTANNSSDAPINVSDIKGRVLFSIPKLGVAVEIIRSPIVTFILIGAAAYLLIRASRRDQEDNEDEINRIKNEIERLKEGQDKNT